MKKLFALLLVVLMLLPCLVACGNKPAESTTDTSTDTDTTTDTSKPSDTDTSKPSDTDTSKPSDTDTGSSSVEKISTKDTVVKKFKGKTLNVLATKWNESNDAPWTLPELSTSGSKGFDALIANGVVERNELIREKYGVTINWIATNSGAVQNDIATSIASGEAGTKYDIAMPRLPQAMGLLTSGTLYDLLSSQYIDLSRSYYNETATTAFSAFGKSFFVGGEFNFLYMYTTEFMFFNKTMAGKIEDFPDLYAMVREGKWTIDEFIKLSKDLVQDDGDGKWTDDDSYGSYLDLNYLFTSSGIKTVSSDGEHGMELTVNDPKLNTIIGKILDIQSATWNRTGWQSTWAAMGAFQRGRLLFYTEVTEKYTSFATIADQVTAGAVPLPKLNEAQEQYYTTAAVQTPLMCIPRTTSDREFAEYMVDVLMWTGSEYIVDNYAKVLENLVPDDKKNEDDERSETMEMLLDYIFPGVIYDAGRIHGYGNNAINNSLTGCYSEGTNNFTKLYEENYEAALDLITEWNDAYQFYED